MTMLVGPGAFAFAQSVWMVPYTAATGTLTVVIILILLGEFRSCASAPRYGPHRMEAAQLRSWRPK